MGIKQLSEKQRTDRGTSDSSQAITERPARGPADWKMTAATIASAAPHTSGRSCSSSTLRGGWRQGAAAVLGINLGCVLHTLAAAFGLAALLATSSEAFAVVKWLGALYLLFVAWGMARDGLRPAVARAEPGPPGYSSWPQRGTYRAKRHQQ